MRVLFVCSANVCRSRVAEDLFRELSAAAGVPHEVRSAGTAAMPPGRQLTAADLAWADIVCVMEPTHHAYVTLRWAALAGKVRVLGIPDIYAPGDPVLKERLTMHVLELLTETGT